MGKTAGIYIRVSTEEQKNGYSLDAQEKTLREYAKNKGYDVFDVYKDGGYSGKDFNRPEVQRLFKDLSADKVDVILVWKVDRLSRNNGDVMSLIDNELKPNDKNLIITSIDMESSTTIGHMFISLLGTFASYERATIIDRVNSGMRQRAEQGYWNGGIILGYDSVDKNLVINQEEGELVKEIFELRSIGKGYKVIANILNGKGHKTKKGKDFSIAGIKAILHNHVYRGKLVWRKHAEWSTKRRKGKTEPIIVQGHHEPIITEELWNKVQSVNEAQKKSFTTNRNFNGNLFLTGILKCPKCGAGTVLSKSKGSKGYLYYYMCQAFHTKGKSACRSNLIKKEVIEPKVLGTIKQMINNKLFVESVVKEIKDKNNDENSLYSKEIKIFKRQLQKLFDKRSKLDEDYFNDNIEASTYNRLIEGLQSKIHELEQSIRTLESKLESQGVELDEDMIIYVLRNFEQLFEKADDKDKKLLIRSLIKEIHVKENRKEIEKITFWFSSVDVLPPNKVRRTVP
ncbi:DNA-invertase hin [Paraliobacillus sp. PM-2]|uniref:recombinase family protein n=1 Tax=Paraliobacillus sp. PM-2 TaxID=1462524 RepID=UPI00061BB2DB|nr:recombinase family protein [Paraliobacillus sp. PM-2]CQR45883.1 DNA-invertase hin [Paraliobacillus sp. PM-2]